MTDRAGVRPVDVGLPLIRWRRSELDRLVAKLPSAPLGEAAVRNAPDPDQARSLGAEDRAGRGVTRCKQPDGAIITRAFPQGRREGHLSRRWRLLRPSLACLSAAFSTSTGPPRIERFFASRSNCPRLARRIWTGLKGFFLLRLAEGASPGRAVSPHAAILRWFLWERVVPPR